MFSLVTRYQLRDTSRSQLINSHSSTACISTALFALSVCVMAATMQRRKSWAKKDDISFRLRQRRFFCWIVCGLLIPNLFPTHNKSFSWFSLHSVIISTQTVLLIDPNWFSILLFPLECIRNVERGSEKERKMIGIIHGWIKWNFITLISRRGLFPLSVGWLTRSWGKSKVDLLLVGLPILHQLPFDQRNRQTLADRT
jgi:hypothetical protein